MEEMELAHTKTDDELLRHFGTSGTDGLSEDRVEDLRAQYGWNGECYTAVAGVSADGALKPHH